ncbi:MAG: glycosyltransferase family 39 protein [Bacteroidales bacterium]|nr:glycosyltransferase family 39 protein [Bacteroidales bacterium]
MSRQARIAIELIIIFCMCCFPLFYRLDTLSVRMWDEARNAVSALEMLQNKNVVVRYFDGNPDDWDVKPPLLIWLQVISMKIFGINELAIRMPSAVAALLTAVFLIFYFHRYHNNRYTGYIAALVLVTSQGYVERHIARTGDHDATLILFTTLIIFIYYEFLTGSRKSNRKLGMVTFLLILSVYTKSIAVMMILPGLLTMTLIYGEHRKIFKNKWFYVCTLAFLLICGSYYLLREHMQPGYLSIVWNEEWFPRYLNTNERFYVGSFFLYIKNLVLSRYTYWLYFLVAAIVILLWQSRKQKRSLPVYLIFNVLIFLLIISAGSKNIWYDGPLYPLMAVIIALFLVQIPRSLTALFRKKNSLIHTAGFLILAALFVSPGISIMKKVKRTHEYSWDEEFYAISYVLRNPGKYPEIMNKPFSIAFINYYGHLLYYTESVELTQKKSIPFRNPEKLSVGEQVLLSEDVTREKINNLYFFEEIMKDGKVQLLKITGYRQSVHPQ